MWTILEISDIFYEIMFFLKNKVSKDCNQLTWNLIYNGKRKRERESEIDFKLLFFEILITNFRHHILNITYIWIIIHWMLSNVTNTTIFAI